MITKYVTSFVIFVLVGRISFDLNKHQRAGIFPLRTLENLSIRYNKRD